MSVTTKEAIALDLLNKTRRITLQRNLSLENSLGTRLSYVRWLWIFALFGYALLVKSLTNSPINFNNPAIYLIGAYAFINLIIMLASGTLGKGSSLLVYVSLVLDAILTTAISFLFDQPIFFFAYVPGIFALILMGIWEGVLTIGLVAVANIIYLSSFSKGFNFQGETALALYGLIGMLLLVAFSIVILVQTSRPLLRISEEMLEEALAKANEAHLLDLQNRARAIYRVANTLSATLDYQKVVKTTLHELETVFDISVGALLLFEGSLSNMRVADGLRLSLDEEQATVSSATGILREVLRNGQPMTVSTGAYLDEIRAIFPSLRNCHTILIMPLRAGFEVFGLLTIASKQANAYGENDIELMTTLTAHTVIAMQNATLYRNLLEDRNKLLTSEEEVRHQLARDLHDGPAQAVAAFSMQAEFIRRLFKSEPDRALDELSSLGKQAQQTSREIRTLLYELRPLVLESQGLVAAMEQYAKRFPNVPNDPYVHFNASNYNSNIRLSPQVETTIFTILQEAVNNARKHAQARNIWLTLAVKDGYIVASAQDDGKGFDVAKVEADYASRGSLGLTNMRERASLVDGQVWLQSAPGQGTAVIVQIPIKEGTIQAS
jgi:signal transduction histidine kinase